MRASRRDAAHPMSARERPTIVAANWKMHAPDPAAWLAAFDRALPRAVRAVAGLRVVLFPPFPLLPAAAGVLPADFELGGQACHWEPAGAFTGEV
ncbi:MAG: triose-phosphate isomerase, partial [Gemmatimonadota bacterium]